MDGRQSFPKRPFPPAKEKPKNADGEGDHDLPGGDSAVGGAAGEGEEEKRARTFSPPKGGSGGNYASYPPGGGGGGRRAGGSGPQPPFCLVERCTANLAEAKRYYRRHKVCEAHSKAPVVIVAGLRQRFCQQCSRFHELSEFDEVKRSCRRRLVGHNERRRKSSSESQGEGSNHFRPAE